MGFQQDAYNATEDSGAAVVCVSLTGSIVRNVSATFFTMDIDAVGRSFKASLSVCIYTFLSSVYRILAEYTCLVLLSADNVWEKQHKFSSYFPRPFSQCLWYGTRKQSDAFHAL